MKFVKFVLDAGGRVAIPAVPAAKNDFASAVDAAQLALDSELNTTRQIYDLVARGDGREELHRAELPAVVRERTREEVSSAETRLSVIRRAGPSVAHGRGLPGPRLKMSLPFVG